MPPSHASLQAQECLVDDDILDLTADEMEITCLRQTLQPVSQINLLSRKDG